MKQFLRRRLLLGLASLAFSGLAAAQAYPARPIRMVLPFAPGGTLDIMARAVAAELSKRMGQSVVVENRAGANGEIGASYVAKTAPADGYTLMMTSASILQLPTVQKKMSFDLDKDLQPVTVGFSYPWIVFAHPAFPPRNLTELAAYVKAHPGTTFATSVPTIHAAVEMFNQHVSGKMTHVPYKGGAESTMAALKGDVNLVVAAPVPGLELAKDGKLRILGVLGTRRSPLLPDAQSASELGITQFPSNSWLGFFLRSGTPAPVVARLHSEIADVLKTEAVREKARLAGLDIEEPITPDEMRKRMGDEINTWNEIFKRTGIQPPSN